MTTQIYKRIITQKKGSSDISLGLPWEIEVHVIPTLLSAEWLARSGRTAGGIGDPANLQPGRVSCSR